MKDDSIKETDDFGENITGWHNLLGWGDREESVAPYVPTPMSVVKSMLEITGAGPGDTVIDLGCGDGRILTMAVEEFNVDRAIGYELNKRLVQTALNNIYNKDLGSKIDVVNKNFMDANLSSATIITLYLTTSGNAKLRQKFIEELCEGTKIISHDFPIMEWVTATENNESIKVGTHKLFIYKAPDAYTLKTIDPEKTSESRWNRIRRLFDRL
ncbi:class I SAM-dependent methyltransferase [Thermoproteota archaeon]